MAGHCVLVNITSEEINEIRQLPGVTFSELAHDPCKLHMNRNSNKTRFPWGRNPGWTGTPSTYKWVQNGNEKTLQVLEVGDGTERELELGLTGRKLAVTAQSPIPNRDFVPPHFYIEFPKISDLTDLTNLSPKDKKIINYFKNPNITQWVERLIFFKDPGKFGLTTIGGSDNTKAKILGEEGYISQGRYAAAILKFCADLGGFSIEVYKIDGQGCTNEKLLALGLIKYYNDVPEKLKSGETGFPTPNDLEDKPPVPFMYGNPPQGHDYDPILSVWIQRDAAG